MKLTNKEIHLNIKIIKNLINSILDSDPQLRIDFLMTRANILAEFEEAEEKLSDYLEFILARDLMDNPERFQAGRCINPTTYQQFMVNKLESILRRNDKPSTAVHSPYYLKSTLETLFQDLLFLRAIQNLDYSYNCLGIARKTSLMAFQSIRYKISKGDLITGYISTTSENKEPFREGNVWKFPISGTYFHKVYRRGFLSTEAGTRPLVILDCDELPEEQQTAWNTPDAVRFFKIKTGCLKEVRKERIQLVSVSKYARNPFQTELSMEDFQKLNPDFESLNQSLRIVPYKQGHYKRPYAAISDERPRDLQYGYKYNAWKSYETAFTEERFLAAHWPLSSKKPILASGTSPARALAVIKNKVIATQLQTNMGIK